MQPARRQPHLSGLPRRAQTSHLLKYLVAGGFARLARGIATHLVPDHQWCSVHDGGRPTLLQSVDRWPQQEPGGRQGREYVAPAPVHPSRNIGAIPEKLKPQPGDGRPRATTLGWGFDEASYKRMPGQHRPDQPPLHSHPAAMHQPYFPPAAGVRRPQVLVDNRGNLSGCERMQIEHVFDRPHDGGWEWTVVFFSPLAEDVGYLPIVNGTLS